MSKKILTLVLVFQPPRILLGLKKRGFGEGRWNGFGGKVKTGESIEQAAKRELQEEAGIIPIDIKKRGIITFEFKSNPEILAVHFFAVSNFTGEIIETEEMKPAWFNISEIPFSQMWPDDKYWLPLFLAGKNFSGHFIFLDPSVILSHKIAEINEI